MAGRGRKRRVQDQHDEESKKTIKPKVPKSNVEENQILALKIFLNSLILQNIVKYLPSSALPNLRSTCKLWNKTMVPELRKRNKKPVLVSKHTTDIVINTLNGCSEILIGKYILMNLSFIAPKIQDLIHKIGNVLTHLYLELTSTSCYLPIATFRTLILKRTPVLYYLQIKDVRRSAVRFWKCKLVPPSSMYNEGSAITLPILKKIALCLSTKNFTRNGSSSLSLINDLLNAAVNLEFVEMYHASPTEDSLNGLVLEALKAKEANLGKLKTIRWRQEIYPKHLETLVELSSRNSSSNNNNRLQLKTFDMSYLHRSCFIGNGQILLNKFLAIQAPSLKTCTAWLAYKNYQLQLPIMNTLETLELQLHFTNPNDGLSNIQFNSLNLNFPNLSKLTLLYMSWMYSTDGTDDALQARQRQWNIFVSQLGQHLGIIELDMALYDDRRCLGDLAAIFPNVTSLEIDFYNSLLIEVWTTWPQLQKLQLNIKYEVVEGDIDSWITGIPVSRLKLLGKAMVNLPGFKNWKAGKTNPGIIDLLDLREFNLRLSVRDEKSYVTDFSGYYGFAVHPSLKRISIGRCSNFSPDCANAVEAVVGLFGHFIK